MLVLKVCATTPVLSAWFFYHHDGTQHSWRDGSGVKSNFVQPQGPEFTSPAPTQNLVTSMHTYNPSTEVMEEEPATITEKGKLQLLHTNWIFFLVWLFRGQDCKI
ncbi:hypothetical protein ACQP3J_27750, partial [Escherichia coli]